MSPTQINSTVRTILTLGSEYSSQIRVQQRDTLALCSRTLFRDPLNLSRPMASPPPRSDAALASIPSHTMRLTETDWYWMSDDEYEYEVDQILTRKGNHPGKRKFLVAWKNYPAEHNTWEPESNLKNSHTLLQQYWATL